MDLRDKTALVTGANGFVGTYVAKRLRDEGLRVRALVRRPEDQAELERSGIEALLGDVTDPLAQEAAVRGAHAVVHCVATDARDLAEARRVNAEATASLAEAALAAGSARFVHISTVGVYALGGQEGVVDEASPLSAEGDAYTVTKIEAEEAVNAAAARGLRAVILRPPVILGVHPTSTWGTKIPKLIADGQFPQVDEGRGVLSYVHVTSLADAVVRALRVDEAAFQTFNIVDGHVRWHQYTDFWNRALPSLAASQAPGLLSFRGSVSSDKAKRTLGFVPRDIFDSSMAEILGALPNS